jgi:hypothetical protein
MASRGVESVKEAGSKAAEKGHDMKESAKDMASKGKESAKHKIHQVADKGHGKKANFLFRVKFVYVNERNSYIQSSKSQLKTPYPKARNLLKRQHQKQLIKDMVNIDEKNG